MSSLIEPIYIDGIITGTLYEPTHMARAVSGRIEGKETSFLIIALMELLLTPQREKSNCAPSVDENPRSEIS